MIGGYLNLCYHLLWHVTVLSVLLTIAAHGSIEKCDSYVMRNSTAGYPVHMLIVGTNDTVVEDALQTLDVGIGVKMVSAECSEIETNYQISQEILGKCSNENTSHENSTLIGVIGPDIQYFQQTLRRSNFPYFMIGETGASADTCQQTDDNIFDAGVEIVQRAKAIGDLAWALSWDYTTVIYDDQSQHIKSLLEEELLNKSVCVDKYLRLSQLPEAINTKGVILLGVSQQEDLPDVIKNLSCIWSLPPDTLQKKEEITGLSDNVYIIKPYRSIANQLTTVITLGKKAYNNSTKDQAPGALLRALQSVEVNCKSRLLKFENGTLIWRPPIPLFSVVQQNKSISRYTETGWSPKLSISNGNSFWCTNKACQAKCLEQITPRNYIYEPGEYIIVVTTNVHETSNTYPDQYTCSNFHQEVSLRTEAALFARDRLNELLGNSVEPRFGVLVLDSCLSTRITQRLLTDVLNGSTPYCNNENQCLDRSKIVGLVGDFASHIGIAEQLLMIPANLLQVAYGSAIHMLDNKTIYTNLLRVHNSNTRVTSNIVKVIKEMNEKEYAKINSVVLVTSSTLYGKSGGTLLKRKLKQSEFCVMEESLELQYDAKYVDVKESYTEFWRTLHTLGKYIDSSLVIVYSGEEKAIRDFLDVLNEKANHELKNWWKESGSIFIMVAIWEDNQKLLKSYGDLLRGSLSFKITPKFEVEGYKKYLKYYTNRRAMRNPWFAKAYQEIERCKIAGDFSKDLTNSSNTAPCQDGYESTEIGNVTTDIYTKNLIKSMYTFGYGIHQYLQQTNPPGAPFVRTKNVTDALKLTLSKIKIPKADNISGPLDLTLFNDNLDGTGGYEVFSQQIDSAHKHLEYVTVYTFTEHDKIQQIPEAQPVFYKSDKEGKDHVKKDLTAMQCKGECSPLCAADESEDEVNVAVILLGVSLALVTVTLIAFVLRNILAKYGYGKLVWKWVRCGGAAEMCRLRCGAETNIDPPDTDSPNNSVVANGDDDSTVSVRMDEFPESVTGESEATGGGGEEESGGEGEETAGEEGRDEEGDGSSYNDGNEQEIESPDSSMHSSGLDYPDGGISVSFTSNASRSYMVAPAITILNRLKGPNSVDDVSVHKPVRKPVPKPRISISSE